MKFPPTKWKDGYPVSENYKSAYAQLDWYWSYHIKRLKDFINSMSHKLTCQECSGYGHFVEPILDYGEGPSFPCGFCEGIGYTTPYNRGLWLRVKKGEKLFRQKHKNLF